MNKKQRNRKLVTQNNRNRIMNRRYTSTIKTLSKVFLTKFKTNSSEAGTLKPQLFTVIKSLYSIIDKAVKKGVIHKNNAARKKSRIGKLYSQVK
jgi:small subunit ribosomal protein S20